MNRIYQKTRKKLLQYTQPEPMLAVGSLSLSLVSIRFTLPPLFIVNHFVSLFLITGICDDEAFLHSEEEKYKCITIHCMIHFFVLPDDKTLDLTCRTALYVNCF